MALHEQSVGATDEWYTPPEVFEAMGVAFDLDVASPGHNVVPWIPAVERFTCDSLSRAWSGFVWMNPPFGARNGVLPWLNKFFAHGDGVALIPDRTAAPWWQAQSPRADRLLFVAKKLKFLTPSPRLGSRKNKDGTRTPVPSDRFPGLYVGTQPAQGTTLLAAGRRAVSALENAERAGLGLIFERRAAA
jgi:hypothetical protein